MWALGQGMAVAGVSNCHALHKHFRVDVNFLFPWHAQKPGFCDDCPVFPAPRHHEVDLTAIAVDERLQNFPSFHTEWLIQFGCVYATYTLSGHRFNAFECLKLQG